MEITPPLLHRWLASADTFAFDMGGVLWRGDEPVPHAGRCISELKSETLGGDKQEPFGSETRHWKPPGGGASG